MIYERILLATYGIIFLTVIIGIIGTVQNGIFFGTPRCALNHYEILNATLESTDSELKRAYRRKVAKFHPDKSLRLSGKEREEAKAQYDRVVLAYEFLLTDGRCAYDRDVMNATAPELQRCFKRVAQRSQQKRRDAEREKAENLLKRQRTVIRKARKAREAKIDRERKELIAYVVGSLALLRRICKGFFNWLVDISYRFLSQFRDNWVAFVLA